LACERECRRVPVAGEQAQLRGCEQQRLGVTAVAERGVEIEPGPG
jgi:hypothetical protein